MHSIDSKSSPQTFILCMYRSGWNEGKWVWSDAKPKGQLLARARPASLMGHHLRAPVFFLTHPRHDKEGQRSSITLSGWVRVKCLGRTTCCRWRRRRVAGDGQWPSSRSWLRFICWLPLTHSSRTLSDPPSFILTSALTHPTEQGLSCCCCCRHGPAQAW